MNIHAALKSQYHASLKTLRLAIEPCPDTMWNNPADGPAPFWRVAYHTLFYAHFYLQRDHLSFTPWPRHREEANYIGLLSRENNRPPKALEPYTKAELLDYCNEIDRAIDPAVDTLDLAAPDCGFPWYQMPKLEHQLVNLRHIQHHAAALATRLRREAPAGGIAVAWVGKA